MHKLNKKGSWFLPFFALTTWILLAMTLFLYLEGAADFKNDYLLGDVPGSIVDAQLRADLTKVNLEIMQEYSYCGTVVDLAKNMGGLTSCTYIGEGSECIWTQDQLIASFTEGFQQRFTEYLASEHMTSETNERALGHADFITDGNSLRFVGRYDQLVDKYTFEVDDQGILKVSGRITKPVKEGEVNSDEGKYDEAISPVNKLTFLGRSEMSRGSLTYVHLDPSFTYSRNYTLNNYKIILDELKIKKECIEQQTDITTCNLFEGRDWKTTVALEHDSVWKFRILTEKCGPQGFIIYEFAIDLNSLNNPSSSNTKSLWREDTDK